MRTFILKAGLTIIVLLSALMTACGGETYTEKNLFYMDTVINIRIPETQSSELVIAECEELIKDIEKDLSKTLADSEVSAFNSSSSGIALSDSTAQLVSLSLDVSRNTGGAFDITCASLSDLWDIKNESPEIPDAALIDGALEITGYEKLSLEGNLLSKADEAVAIDLGGIGKGYALGVVCEHLADIGVTHGTVSFGGNVGLIGEKPDGTEWKVGVKDPFNTENIIGTLTLEGGYVAVSGDYERYFELDGVRYHHILDPHTGYPASSGVHSVAVVCDDPALGDALSTALFVMGYEKSVGLYESCVYTFEAVFVTDEGVKTTEGIKDRFSIK